MAYVLTGYKRSISVSVSKSINGVPSVGYPKTYPTATDISNGYFTYNAVQYDLPDSQEELAQMSDVDFATLLAALKLYVMTLEPGINFETDTVVEAVYLDEAGCPPGTPVTTTTTTAAPAPTTTTTTVALPCDAYCVTNISGFADSYYYYNCSGVWTGVALNDGESATIYASAISADLAFTVEAGVCPTTTTTTVAVTTTTTSGA